MAATTLVIWVWFVDILVENGFMQRSNAISQAQIGRSSDAPAAARGVLPEYKKQQSACMIGAFVYI